MISAARLSVEDIFTLENINASISNKTGIGSNFLLCVLRTSVSKSVCMVLTTKSVVVAHIYKTGKDLLSR